MTATNMCSNFGGFMYSPLLRVMMLVPAKMLVLYFKIQTTSPRYSFGSYWLPLGH